MNKCKYLPPPPILQLRIGQPGREWKWPQNTLWGLSSDFCCFSNTFKESSFSSPCSAKEPKVKGKGTRHLPALWWWRWRIHFSPLTLTFIISIWGFTLPEDTAWGGKGWEQEHTPCRLWEQVGANPLPLLAAAKGTGNPALPQSRQVWASSSFLFSLPVQDFCVQSFKKSLKQAVKCCRVVQSLAELERSVYDLLRKNGMIENNVTCV